MANGLPRGGCRPPEPLDRSQGKLNKSLFETYVKLPRHSAYVNQDYLRSLDKKYSNARRWRVSNSANYASMTGLRPIGNDEPLVRSYLMHFLLSAKTWKDKAYTTYVNDIYLREVYAETKILAGIGNMEEMYSLLPPAKYKALKDRIDIEFAYTNPKIILPADKVHLDVNVKNVKKLIVKVFEIDELNYYRAKGKQIDTTIDLDGLVANSEKTYEYPEPPMRRVKRGFDFPEGNAPRPVITSSSCSGFMAIRSRISCLERRP